MKAERSIKLQKNENDRGKQRKKMTEVVLETTTS
jgi:hypothetical protein